MKSQNFNWKRSKLSYFKYKSIYKSKSLYSSKEGILKFQACYPSNFQSIQIQNLKIQNPENVETKMQKFKASRSSTNCKLRAPFKLILLSNISYES